MSLTSLRGIVRDIRKKTGEKIIKNVSVIGYTLDTHRLSLRKTT